MQVLLFWISASYHRLYMQSTFQISYHNLLCNYTNYVINITPLYRSFVSLANFIYLEKTFSSLQLIWLIAVIFIHIKNLKKYLKTILKLVTIEWADDYSCVLISTKEDNSCYQNENLRTCTISIRKVFFRIHLRVTR